MGDINFIELEEVIAIHHNQVQKHGGSHGIRDFDLLISAVSRPQASFAGRYLYPGIFSKAASLMHSLIFNHPFVDGNKRTAMVSTARLLYLNGYQLKTGKKNIVEVALRVESKKWNLDKIASWLKSNSRRMRG